ncbi:uncharacterized protein SPAPADRAFT_62447 [Spathaspora passalidarum NRRL Y-27907]|uniref:Protein YIP n=1 Tax=Spathaspora passalidarum (strain NRRL Y-27907 / 11-Y1) TaxID=619300 RepID=G3ARY5_SPAPN|nr:uncharacterized protein SPAPADRAFT_62447 [Spathaspora passalidarum NRRL Y-27907]EGW31834.1 hypothetical protein SPAPADRAFT_62447 [Spathaspora passalidarum NRRL Y-27907]
MSQWNSTTITPDVDEFIIPDEDSTPPQSRQTGANNNTFGSTGNAGSTGNTESANPFSTFSPFNFVPKVDLSSTFAPFAGTNVQLPDNNTFRERQYSGGDTLDEPILETLKRDLLQIAKRLAIVVWPMQLSKLAKQQQSRFVTFASSNGIQLPQSLVDNRVISVPEEEEDVGVTGISSGDLLGQNLEWDLWGPLIFSLTYAVTLGVSASKDQTNQVFTGSFSFMWIFFIIIGLNVQLLGGTISFMSAISAAGYSMFPIVVGELLCSLLIKWKLVRLGLMFVLDVWSIYAGIMSLKCSGVFPGRVTLAIYPIILFYSVLSWLTVIT